VIGVSSGVEKIVDNIKDTIRICSSKLLDYEVRTTVVPTLIDDEHSIREIAQAVRDAPSYVLQQFYPSDTVLNEKLRTIQSPKRRHLHSLARVAKAEGIRHVYIRTRTHGLEEVD
jgi:pyruvate-formate lyase-activating enzyme